VRIAVIGLPNSSKTTIFNALTRGHSETAAFSSGKFEVNTGVVAVPDPRVDRLTAMFKPRKTAYAQVTYADISGLDKGVGKGGLEGTLLNALSESDALLHVVRAFEDPSVPHSEGNVDPHRDIEIVDIELLLSDLGIVEKRIERLQHDLERGANKDKRAANEAEMALLQRVQAHLAADQPLRDMDLTPAELKMLRNFGLLTLKPLLVVINVGDHRPEDGLERFAFYQHKQTMLVPLQGRLEMELAHMAPEEAAEFLPEYGIEEPGLNRLIRVSYDLLGLQSFFTVGEDEVRAWTIRVGATAEEAAGVIHTDLAKGFIRAEVVAYDDLIAAGGMVEASKRGQARLEGRDYVVKDGDIMNIRFNI
jgi:GTP-binding protein YchF